jgi:uncharacterized protein (TIGR03083 family)
MTPAATAWIAALRGSHEHLSDLVAPLSADAVAEPAYPSEWSIAQVLSHLGSGAVIFAHFLDAAKTGGPTPGRELMAPIWDEWNAKSPQDQAADAVVADGRLVDLFEAAAAGPDAGELRLNFIGRELDLAGVASLRLTEHALHTWDVAVALDPSATVAPQPTALLIDTIGAVVGRAGKSALSSRVHVTTTEPAREFLLTLGDEPSLAPWGADPSQPPADAELHLPAESLLRLFSGRLDPEHTPPPVAATGIDLADLRTSFPGY